MSIDEALAACIAAVEQGASVEQCLADYPEYANEFEPILRLIHQTQTTELPSMSDAGFARGRRRVFQAARIHQRLRSTDRPQPLIQHPENTALGGHHPFGTTHKAAAPFLRPDFSHSRSHPALVEGESTRDVPPESLLITARGTSPAPRIQGRFRHFVTLPTAAGVGLAACLLLGLILFGQLVNRSLPGSPLYTLKLSGEQVETALVGTDSARARQLARATERRFEELAVLESQGRSVDPGWLTEVQEQVFRTLAAGSALPIEERVHFLDDWLHTLRELEQDIALTAAQQPATLGALQRAVGALEASLVAEELVVLAPTPTLAPVVEPGTTPDQGVTAPPAAQAEQSEEATAPTPEQIALATPGQSTGAQPGRPATGSETAPAAGAEVAAPEIKGDAGREPEPNTGANLEEDASSAPDNPPPSTNGGAVTVPGQGGQSSPAGTTATATPSPGLNGSAAQPQATPSPTWTAVPTRPGGTAVAMAEQPRETLGLAERPGDESEDLPERPGSPDAPAEDSDFTHEEADATETATAPITESTIISGPLPSLTVTPTLTITPTHTPTLTATLTATLTGTPAPESDTEAIATPVNGLPTLIPTYTPVPPTSTPLPSQETATPTPGAPENGSDETPAATPSPTPGVTVTPPADEEDQAESEATATAVSESLSSPDEMRSRSETDTNGTPDTDNREP